VTFDRLPNKTTISNAHHLPYVMPSTTHIWTEVDMQAIPFWQLRATLPKVCAALASLVLLFDSGEAGAAHTRSYPGAWCTYASGATNSIYAGTISDPSSTTDTGVVCPLLGFAGDGAPGITSSQLTQWYARVFDRSSADFYCTMTAETPNSGGFTQVLDTQHTISTNQAAYVTIGNGSLSNMTGEYLYVACTIPHSTASGYSHLIDILTYGGPNI
jgi:hypothetical protein